MRSYMRISTRIACILFAATLFTVMFASCDSTDKQTVKTDVPKTFTTFRDIPGITDAEIKGIEDLKKEKNRSFIYGMPLSTEMFYTKDGEAKGFSVLFCKWLSELYGIEFKPVQCEWLDLLKGLDNGKIDFTGEISATKERQKKYLMTSAIAERTIKYFCLTGSRSFNEIMKYRPLKCGFIEKTNMVNTVTAEFKPKTYKMLPAETLTDEEIQRIEEAKRSGIRTDIDELLKYIDSQI